MQTRVARQPVDECPADGSIDFLPMETMNASLSDDEPDGDSGRDDDHDDDCVLVVRPPPPPPYTKPHL